jgi:hypothetical protein
MRSSSQVERCATRAGASAVGLFRVLRFFHVRGPVSPALGPENTRLPPVAGERGDLGPRGQKHRPRRDTLSPMHRSDCGRFAASACHAPMRRANGCVVGGRWIMRSSNARETCRHCIDAFVECSRDMPDCIDAFGECSRDMPEHIDAFAECSRDMPERIDGFAECTRDIPERIDAFIECTRDMPECIDAFVECSRDMPECINAFAECSRGMAHGMNAFDDRERPVRAMLRGPGAAFRPQPAATEATIGRMCPMRPMHARVHRAHPGYAATHSCAP